MTVWELLGVLGKALIYIGILSAAGGTLMLWLGRSSIVLVRMLGQQYLLPTALVGLLAACLVFLSQIGSVNQSGLAGMFDPVIGGILVDTEAGSLLRWRLAGFMLMLLAIIPLNLPGDFWGKTRTRQFSLLTLLLAILCLTISVASQGHAASVSLLAQCLVAAHVLAIAAWAGSFYPLYRSLLHADISAPDVVQLAERFGQIAWAILAIMLLSGIPLLWIIAGGPLSLTDDTHGRLLLVKLVMVALMMALGALHKFVLVAGLRSAIQAQDQENVSDSRRLLARSIRSETLLAVLVLLLTATMTTVTGPAP